MIIQVSDSIFPPISANERTDLYTSLTNMDGDNFTHFEKERRSDEGMDVQIDRGPMCIIFGRGLRVVKLVQTQTSARIYTTVNTGYGSVKENWFNTLKSQVNCIWYLTRII